jgi:hypothetical protein
VLALHKAALGDRLQDECEHLLVHFCASDIAAGLLKYRPRTQKPQPKEWRRMQLIEARAASRGGATKVSGSIMLRAQDTANALGQGARRQHLDQTQEFNVRTRARSLIP